VVNDGSDQHLEKIKPYLNKIRFLEKTNGGTASALNVGFSNATGDYLSWLSSDDLFIKDKTTKQLSFMSKNNSYFCYTNYSLIDKNNVVFKHMAGVYYPNKLQLLQKLKVGNNINGCTVMLKKEVYDNIGAFNEDLKYTQDYDYWLRTIQHYELYYLNEPLIHYRVHDQMGTKQFKESIPQEIQRVQNYYKKKLNHLIIKERKKR
jgi:glycosyltransferase involved in cell wall biosynthesis